MNELIGADRLHLHSWNTLIHTKYGNTSCFQFDTKEQSATLPLNRCDILDSKMAHTRETSSQHTCCKGYVQNPRNK